MRRKPLTKRKTGLNESSVQSMLNLANYN